MVIFLRMNWKIIKNQITHDLRELSKLIKRVNFNYTTFYKIDLINKNRYCSLIKWKLKK